MSSPAEAASRGARLKRSLGLWSIVGLGLGYMTPTVVFDTFGMVGRDTNNVVPLAYLVALIVMLFTALSYGRMAAAMPSAGSAFTYVRESLHPNLGFMVGWTSMLDYMLLPMVNCLIVRSYLEAFFPDIPGWIWVVVYVVVVTGIIYITMRGTSNFNMLLLVFALIVMAVFIGMVIVQLLGGAGRGTLVSPVPFIHDGVTLPAVLMGSTIVCFSFIGFDAITMYVEEAKTPRTVPRAIVITVLLGGAIFLIGAYFSQLRFPNWETFAPNGDMQFIEDSTLPLMAKSVGGHTLQVVLTAAGFAASVASGLASHASVSRLLLVMGRNAVLPQRLFGYINPQTHTPTFNILLTGAFSLMAMAFSLEQIAAFINFGALIAFTFVNISVIAWYFVRQKQRHGAKNVFWYLVMPAIATLLTGILWAFLDGHSLIGGTIWAALGFVWLLWITRGFRRKAKGFDETEPVTGFNKLPDDAYVDDNVKRS